MEQAPAVAVLPAPSADWDAYVRRHADAPVYLCSGWSLLAREVFGHETFFIEGRDAAGMLVGVLPVVRQRGVLGDFATSVPFFNYGGALADADAIALLLMDHAREHVRSLGCSYLELRDVRARGGDWSLRTDKVSMVLALPRNGEILAKQLGSKLRSQIRRSEREAAKVRSGGMELLDAFYAVFSENMRDLGTPVHPKKFFAAVLRRFAENTLLLVVDHCDRPSAAGFLVFNGTRAEIPWAACRSAAKPIGLNMKLYWEVLSACMERGCTSFDFGRSTADSGTYRFKQQWGAQPMQLYWHRWERRPTHAGAPDPSAGRLMQCATGVWRRLPLPVANMLGPLVSPGLPW
jgi:FemAB-related protein (PEP-CTERM system-associated)